MNEAAVFCNLLCMVVAGPDQDVRAMIRECDRMNRDESKHRKAMGSGPVKSPRFVVITSEPMGAAL